MNVLLSTFHLQENNFMIYNKFQGSNRIHKRTIDYNLITEKADIWIRSPSDEESVHPAKMKWLEKYRFPTGMGALDCTLIRVKKMSSSLWS